MFPLDIISSEECYNTSQASTVTATVTVLNGLSLQSQDCIVIQVRTYA